MLEGDKARERAAEDKRVMGMAGLATLGSLVTGTLGFVLGVFLVLVGQPTAAAVALVASALAFGLAANALLRS
ncbi:MAG: hypothetical protein WEB88_07165 [Gemmatimonadota bacterium]